MNLDIYVGSILLELVLNWYESGSFFNHYITVGFYLQNCDNQYLCKMNNKNFDQLEKYLPGT